MKKIFLLLSVSSFMAATIFISCQSSGRKVADAENNVQDTKNDVAVAKQDLTKTIQDSINTEHQEFKTNSEVKLSANEKSIAEFKTRISYTKKAAKAHYEEELTVLVDKNADLENKLQDYKEDGMGKWDSFKNKFNHDIDSLGENFKEFTKKYRKVI